MTIHSATEKVSGGDKRERILAAAERVFARRGFFASRVSEIAKDAGVADGTIYLYFKSKDDLLISLFEQRMKQVNATLKEAVASQKDKRETSIDQLRSFIKAYLKLCHDEPAATEVLTIELRQSNKFMKEYENAEFADFLRMLSGLIAKGQDAGELDDSVPAHVAARMIFGMLDELALAWVLAKQPIQATKPKKFDIVRAADWVVALVTTGLAKKQQETP